MHTKSNILKYVWCKFRLAVRQFGQFICALKFREWIKTMFLLYYSFIAFSEMAKSGRKTHPKTILFSKITSSYAPDAVQGAREMHTHREKERIWAEKIKRHWHHFWYIGQQNERNDPNVHIFQSNTIHCVRIRSNFTVNIWSEIILLKRPVLNVNHVSDFFLFLISFNFSSHLFSVFHFYCHFKFTRWLRAHGFWILNRI